MQNSVFCNTHVIKRMHFVNIVLLNRNYRINVDGADLKIVFLLSNDTYS